MAGGYGFCYSALLFQGFPEGDMVERSMEKGPEDLRLPTGLRSLTVPVAALCAGCGGPICDRYFLFAVDRHWHLPCLKCCMCQLALGSELTCFSKDGGIYCKTDYYRRFSVNRCAKCHMGIAASEMVMKARDAVYHVGCFSCFRCSAPLRTGDLFGLRDGELYCHRHCQAGPGGSREDEEEEEAEPCPAAENLLLVTDRLPPADADMMDGTALALLSNKPPRKGRGRGRRRHSYGGTSNPGICTPDSEEGDPSPEPRKQRRPRQPPRVPKVKRVRTSFKNHQLRTMESYFSIKHNPDGKDWEQLAKKTGLPKRVLQNARAKLRKSLSQEGSPEMGCSADTPDEAQPSPAPESPAETFPRSPDPLFSLQDFSSPYPSLPKAAYAPMMPLFLNFGLKEAGPSPPPYC